MRGLLFPPPELSVSQGLQGLPGRQPLVPQDDGPVDGFFQPIGEGLRLLARGIVVVDKNDKVVYVEY